MISDNRKSVWAWAFYDWANSAFATTVMAGFFPVFFKQFWNAGVDFTVSSARLGLANSIAGIVIAVSAPILGAIADKGSSKKQFLMFFAYMGIVMTSALFLVSRGNWVAAAVLYLLASIGFSGGNIFYDSLITGVASEKKMDSVSSLGFSLGYAGGGILLALNVWMALNPGLFGFESSADAVKASFLSVGIWWAVFSIPVFLFVKEPEINAPCKDNMIAAGFSQLRSTLREIRKLKNIFLFLTAYWLYIDGVDTIIRMAVDYGISIGFDSTDLIKALLITQFVGFPSAAGFGYLGGLIGTRRGILLAIFIYLFITIWGAFIREKSEFYMLAILIGLVQGGVQALSRSFFAKMIPVERSAEFFGFYNMLGKFAVVIGPVFMAGVGLLMRSLGFSGDFSARAGMFSIAILFLAGGTLLCFVKEVRVNS